MPKNDSPKEDLEQINFVAWFKYNYPDMLINHSPAGGTRHMGEAIKFKRLGVCKGWPDLEFPSLGKRGLFIELKRVKGGVVSKEQKEVMSKLTEIGYTCYVAKGFEEAKKIILKHIDN